MIWFAKYQIMELIFLNIPQKLWYFKLRLNTKSQRAPWRTLVSINLYCVTIRWRTKC